VALEPLVDPLPLQTNRAPAADANVTQLTALARSVDGVAAHAGILRTLGNVQPEFHTGLLERIENTEPMDCVGWCR
jgi:hypothetical protein